MSFTGDVRSRDTEIFPGKKIAFVVKKLPEKDPSGKKYKYTRYTPLEGPWTEITEWDKFVSLEVVAGEGVVPPRLAGMVEIILGRSSQAFRFGDPQNGEYLQFDATRSLVLKPRKVYDISTSDH